MKLTKRKGFNFFRSYYDVRLIDGQIMERQSFSDLVAFDKFDKFLNPIK